MSGFTYSSICGRSTLVLELLSWELSFGGFLFIGFSRGMQRAAYRTDQSAGFRFSEPGVVAGRSAQLVLGQIAVPFGKSDRDAFLLGQSGMVAGRPAFIAVGEVALTLGGSHFAGFPWGERGSVT